MREYLRNGFSARTCARRAVRTCFSATGGNGSPDGWARPLRFAERRNFSLADGFTGKPRANQLGEGRFAVDAENVAESIGNFAQGGVGLHRIVKAGHKVFCAASGLAQGGQT